MLMQQARRDKQLLYRNGTQKDRNLTYLYSRWEAVYFIPLLKQHLLINIKIVF